MTLTLPDVKGSALNTAEMNANWQHCLDRLNMTGSEASAGIFVRRNGSDANGGTHWDKPKLTLASAMTAASALVAAGAPACLIDVLDGGTYTEAAQLVTPANIHVRAPASRFVGTVAVAAQGSFVVDKHFAQANDDIMAQHEGGSDGPALYVTNISDGRGVGGALTGVRNVRNVGGGGKNYFVRTGVLYVGASGTGIGDVSSGNAGHIHCLVPDLYLAGNDALGILGSAQGAGSSNIIGFADHILEIGGPTGTVGIRVNAAAAVVRIVAAQVIADTAFDVSAGRLSLNCLDVTGTETHTGGTVVRPTVSTVAL